MDITTLCIRPVVKDNLNKDEIFMYDSNKEIFYKFLEDSNYQRIVNEAFDNKILSFNEIKIKPDENVHYI